MSLLDKLDSKENWLEFYRFRLERQHLSKREAAKLLAFIENADYTAAVKRIRDGRGFSYPRKCLISKHSSPKKRAVYIYPEDEAYVLKLLTYLMRGYDPCFGDNLYSFRASKSVRDAVQKLTGLNRTAGLYSYKVDISDYFNSIDIPLLMPMLESTLSNDRPLFEFLRSLLENPYCLEGGQPVKAQKGVMAGVPFSGFCANIFLKSLDEAFSGRLYARYSDDIIVFSESEAQRDRDEALIKQLLYEMKLTVNPSKEVRTSPGEQWTFLGISYSQGIIDVAPVSVQKLKAKLRRKTRALIRWRIKNGLEPRCAARALIKHFNRRFFETSDPDETTWCRWYFPLINTDRSLKEIDAYMQQCIRYIMTGTRTKAMYNFRYDEMKLLGYRTLTGEYYSCD